MRRAFAAFERTIVTRDAPADRYADGDTSALDERAVRGRTLFFGRAGGSTCHGGPNFTDGLFHNAGVMGEDIGRAAFDRVGEFQMRPYPFLQMRRASKTPSLRNVAPTAPDQHDGSEATPLEVVTFDNSWRFSKPSPGPRTRTFRRCRPHKYNRQLAAGKNPRPAASARLGVTAR